MNKIDKIEKSFVKVVCAGWAVLTVSLAQGGTVAYWPMVMDPATGGIRKLSHLTCNSRSGVALFCGLGEV